MKNPSTYRRDIDGLRAIAVLLVIFYHAGIATISGGFIGVDVFFVISGYLITGIIYDEMAAGEFSFSRFYIRRIRRILPALYFLLAITLIISWFMLLPPDLVGLGESTLAAVSFVSNFYFGSVTDGYFAPEVELLPLIHTWSLAVEEQFYLVWPPLLLLLYRRFNPRLIIVLTVLMAAASFLFAEMEARALDDRAYYSLQTRAGELLMGALLALAHRQPRQWQLPAMSNNLLGLIGLLAILIPAFTLGELSVFPGINAFWPCLGCVLLIHTGQQQHSLVARLLSTRPIVAIGLISYSLYLWHWPILVFADYLRLERSHAITLVCISLTFLMAYVSWRYVEQPLRKKSFADFKSAFKAGVLIPAGLFATICIPLILLEGAYFRLDERAETVIKLAEQAPSTIRGVCFKSDQPELPPATDCLLGATDQQPSALLWGDSFANQLSGFFDVVGKSEQFALRDVTMGGCPPLLATRLNKHKKALRCQQRNDKVIEYIRSAGIEKVYITGDWVRYLTLYENWLIDDKTQTASAEDAYRVFSEGLLRTVAAIIEAGKTPVLISMIPAFDSPPSDCAIKNLMHPPLFHRDCSINYDHQQQMHSSDAVYQLAVSSYPQTEVLYLNGLICPDDRCEAYMDEKPMYLLGWGNHLNMQGSYALGKNYLKQTISSPGSDAETVELN